MEKSQTITETKKRITSYWSKRSDSFFDQRKEELKDGLAARWLDEISLWLPKGKKLKVLDVGCGAGFFSVLLAREGHHVTGIDLTEDMIRCAKELAAEEKVVCEFLCMDAEKPEFPDETFDLVIARNLTWTLPNPELAYGQWVRVLKTGGILLNFDADLRKSDFSDDEGLPPEHAHHKVSSELKSECEEIRKSLSINEQPRPFWDAMILEQLEMEDIVTDFAVKDRLYTKKDQFYNPDPVFMICARKKEPEEEHLLRMQVEHGHVHDAEQKKAVLNRLSKAIGHLNSIKRMVERDEDCSEVLIQMAAVRSAINNAGKVILKHHLESCIVEAIKEEDFKTVERMNDAIDKFMK